MSDELAIECREVGKIYKLDLWFQGGLKNALLRHSWLGGNPADRRVVQALVDVSFEVRRGENFAIIGSNGSGKSTTLGLMAGVLRPSRGQVIVRGRVSPLLELGAGFHPELSGWDNIVLNGILLGMTKRLVMSRMEQIIEFSGLRESIDNPLRTYSSGMVARLGFSVVVHLEPEILLIDEVLAVGDAQFAKKCLAEMDRFKNSPTTIVFVSHDLASVERLCERAAVLDHGKLRFVGPSAEAVRVYSDNLAGIQSGR